ncbi:MAG: LptF/LptG family permease [Candidatus Omnitrophota bacterium]
MRILDRYIAKSVISIFFGCLLTFFLLYLVIDTFTNLSNILKQKISLDILLSYYSAYLPLIFVQVSPIASLLSTLYCFAGLNKGNEIIAMRSAGLSIWQIAKFSLLFGVIISIVVFWVNDKFVPQSLITTEKLHAVIEGQTDRIKEKEGAAITNLSMYGLKNRLFFVNKFSLATETMEQIVILEHDEKQNITKKMVANKGIYKDGTWRFYQCITYNFDQSGQVIDEPQYMPEEIMTIPESPQEFLHQRQRQELMTIAELQDYIWRLSKSGATTVIRNLKVDLYQKFTTPLTNIIIILMGIPFAFKMTKRATGLASLGVSIMVGFVYYVMSAIGVALGKGGYLPPLIAVSTSHIIVLSTSIYLIRKLR